MVLRWPDFRWNGRAKSALRIGTVVRARVRDGHGRRREIGRSVDRDLEITEPERCVRQAEAERIRGLMSVARQQPMPVPSVVDLGDRIGIPVRKVRFVARSALPVTPIGVIGLP